jgi:hypothetical protein
MVQLTPIRSLLPFGEGGARSEEFEQGKAIEAGYEIYDEALNVGKRIPETGK